MKIGDNVRSLKDQTTNQGQNPIKTGSIYTVFGTGDGTNLWFTEDGKGYYKGEDFELVVEPIELFPIY